MKPCRHATRRARVSDPQCLGFGKTFVEKARLQHNACGDAYLSEYDPRSAWERLAVSNMIELEFLLNRAKARAKLYSQPNTDLSEHSRATLLKLNAQVIREWSRDLAFFKREFARMRRESGSPRPELDPLQ